MKEIKVRIKTWQEMKEEFPSYGADMLDLDSDFYFTQGTEALLPEDRIIVVQDIDKSYFDWNGWGISSGMIKEYL